MLKGDMGMKNVDGSELNACIFDEAHCNDIHVLIIIKQFIDNTKYKVSIATGDSEHLKPVSEITQQDLDYDGYMDSVMS